MSETKDPAEVEIRIVGPADERRAIDSEAEGRIVDLMRHHVLPLTEAEAAHRTAQVEVRRTTDGTPAYVIAYMLRRDTYTADVVRINVDAQYGFVGIEWDYDGS